MIYLEREQFAIEKMEATNRHKGYNICVAGRNRHGVKASEETREKLRISHIGHKASEETKRIMSEQKKGNQYNKGRKWSKEAVEKRRKSNIGKKRTPEQIARMVLGHKNSKQKKVWEEINKPLDYTCDMWV